MTHLRATRIKRVCKSWEWIRPPKKKVQSEMRAGPNTESGQLQHQELRERKSTGKAERKWLERNVENWTSWLSQSKERVGCPPLLVSTPEGVY